MTTSVYPSEFIRLSTATTKTLNVVLCLEGIDECFSTVPTYTRVRYGDPGIYYGQPGLIYGGLRILTDVNAFLSIDSNLTVSQRLEPEQGRASISQMTFQLVDKDGRVSDLLLGAGEILGRRLQVAVGYQDSSYPDDYLISFRGIVTSVNFQTGRVVLSSGDLGQRRRSAIFRAKRTALTSSISDSDLIIPVNDVSGFYDLTIDQSALPVNQWRVKPYLKIENEFLLYGYGAASGSNMTVLERGSRSTTPAAHATNKEVSHVVELQENALTLALMIMLSGNGDVSLPSAQAFGVMIDPDLTPAANLIVLPTTVDANRDYGLVVGDSITISGSTGNDGTYTVTELGPVFGEPNRAIYLNTALSYESPATGTLTFRSQFDVLPEQIGLKIPPADVDVSGHITTRDLYFSGTEYTLTIFVTDQKTGKEFIEAQCYLPIGAYALTRYGRLSVGFTRPPLADQKLIFLDDTNVIDPAGIQTSRGLNTRKFFNEIQYEYDQADAGNYQSVIRALDTDSLNEIGLLSLLPIKSGGLKGGAGAQVVNRVARRLLSRYKKGAVEISLKVNFAAGSQIEAGDVVALEDNGTLAIQNFETGNRYLGSMLLEVVDRTLDLKTGQTSLKLVTGIGTNLTDRFGTIAPSSLISATGTTTTRLKLKTSFGSTVQADKWADYAGQQVVVRSSDYSISEEVTFVQFVETEDDVMEVTPALSFTPPEDYVVELPSYPNTTDSSDAAIYKMIHSFHTPTLTVVVGSTPLIVNLSVSDAAKCTVGQFVIVHNADYSIASDEVEIEVVGPNSITLKDSLGFSPAAGLKVDLVGFIDGGGPYRFT